MKRIICWLIGHQFRVLSRFEDTWRGTSWTRWKCGCCGRIEAHPS